MPVKMTIFLQNFSVHSKKMYVIKNLFYHSFIHFIYCLARNIGHAERYTIGTRKFYWFQCLEQRLDDRRDEKSYLVQVYDERRFHSMEYKWLDIHKQDKFNRVQGNLESLSIRTSLESKSLHSVNRRPYICSHSL